MTSTTQERPPAAPSSPEVRVLGSRVMLVTTRDVVSRMEGWIARRDRCRRVVVTGFHGLWEAHKDPELKRILNTADLWAPDGIAPVLLARLRGRTAVRTPGAEIMRAFFEAAAARGYSSFFLGDTDDTLAALRARVEREYPGHRVAGTLSPPFRPLTPAEDDAIVEQVNDARPDVLWVGLGTPKQDRWIHDRRHRLQVPVAAGVGAAFRFVSGRVKRAPQWVGDLGLEWLWRLAHEPRKLWRRALCDGPRFALHAGLELAGLRRYS